MTNTQIDELIEQVKPEIRIAIRAVMQGKAVDIFTLAEGKNSQTGVRSKIVMFVAHEAPAALLEATANGLTACGKVYERLFAEGWKPPAPPYKEPL